MGRYQHKNYSSHIRSCFLLSSAGSTPASATLPGNSDPAFRLVHHWVILGLRYLRCVRRQFGLIGWFTVGFLWFKSYVWVGELLRCYRAFRLGLSSTRNPDVGHTSSGDKRAHTCWSESSLSCFRVALYRFSLRRRGGLRQHSQWDLNPPATHSGNSQARFGTLTPLARSCLLDRPLPLGVTHTLAPGSVWSSVGLTIAVSSVTRSGNNRSTTSG